MTGTSHTETSFAAASLGLAVHCTRGALGEWFTLIPRSPQRASDLRRCGVPAGASLTGADVRYELERLGVPEAEIEVAVAHARRAATTITLQRTAGSFLHRLFG
jgi:hypothetical protein